MYHMEQRGDVKNRRPGPLTSDIYPQKSEKSSLPVTPWSYKMGAGRLSQTGSESRHSTGRIYAPCGRIQRSGNCSEVRGSPCSCPRAHGSILCLCFSGNRITSLVCPHRPAAWRHLGRKSSVLYPEREKAASLDSSL